MYTMDNCAVETHIYVWFPLVPYWDVLSIAWKCSKYRFWVCSNDLILRTSPL